MSCNFYIKKCLDKEEILIIIFSLTFSCITMPILSIKHKNSEIKKKIKLATILQILVFFLVLIKIVIRNVTCINMPIRFQHYPFVFEVVNLITMLGLIICLSLLNSLWWEFYYTRYKTIGKFYLFMFMISILCLSWIPFSLKTTFFPKELTSCVDTFRNQFSERFNKNSGTSIQKVKQD